MACKHFADTSVVALEDGRLVGFVIAYRPPPGPEAVFVWQIGVDPSQQGQGLGARMLDEIVSRPQARYLEATVTPSNERSVHLFRSFAKRHDAEIVEETCFPSSLFPGAHEEEVLLRIGPVT